MTISVPEQLVFAYNGDGSTTVFSYPVRFLDQDEIIVISRVAGVDAVKVLDTDYTVAGAGDANGGSITTLYVPAVGETIILRRATEAKQIVNLADGQRTPAEAVEQQFDRLAMVAQDHDQRIDDVETKILAVDQAVESAQQSAALAAASEENAAASDASAAVSAAAAAASAASVDYLTVADRTALKALDTEAHTIISLREPGREGVFKWNSGDLSAFVTADTAEGIYVAPSSDTTGASGAWVRQHDGEWSPEWFGATPVTDWDAPEDSTAAFSGWASLINTLSAPFKTVLSGFYRSTAAIVLTASTLAIAAPEPGQAGFFFDNSDGISLTQSYAMDGFAVTGVAFITNASNTKTAFSYAGAFNTGSSMLRTLDRCAWIGLDRYRRDKEGAASSNLNGWLTEFSADEGDNIFVTHPVIFGAENDRQTGFDEETAGFFVTDSTHFVLEFPRVFFKKTGVKLRGQSENLEVRGGALVANFRGIDCEHDTSPANDHNITGVHIASFDYDINIGIGGTVTNTSMHNISECLLFTRSGAAASEVDISTGFAFVKTNAQCQITNNYFFVDLNVDSITKALIGADIQGTAKGCQIIGNVAGSLGTVVRVGASATHTVIAGNLTSDNAATLAVSPVIDNGAFTYIGENYGDRTTQWPSKAFVNGVWAKSGAFSILVGASGRTLMTGTNAANSVNYFDLLNSAAGAPPELRALGTDANIDLRLTPKGAGGVRLLTPTTAPTLTANGELTFERTSNTSLTIKVRGTDGVTRSGSITLA